MSKNPLDLSNPSVDDSSPNNTRFTPTLADGVDATQGATTDAAVTTDSNGTISAKLRGLVKILGDVWNSTSHFLNVSLTTGIAGEDIVGDVQKVEQRNGYTNITTATTTVIKSGVGLLHAIVVNTTAAGTITIYDNTSGSGTKIGTMKASIAENTYIFDVAFTVGLTIVTGAASDITVSSR